MEENIEFKNNEKANEFRAIGNRFYKSRNFYQALLNYNKSICYARPNSVEFALIFANRSSIYYEIEAYEICMENIQLALNFGYPKDKTERLVERHERCREILFYQQLTENKEEFSLLKLSHPPHATIPFIVDCIEMRNSKRFGNYLVTTRKLKAGDIIAIESPFYKFIMNTSRYSHCANCLKSEKMNLFPCCECNYTMFCSQQCMTIGRRFHQFDCTKIKLDIETESDIFQMNHRMVFEALGIFEKIEALKDFMDENSQTQKTIFDLDLSDGIDCDKKLLLATNTSLQRNSMPKKLAPLMERHCALMMSITSNECHKTFLRDFMKQQMEILITNTFGLVENEKEIGSGIFPFASFFNHSCAPNIARITVDGQLIFIVARPIEINHQLFVCYREDFHHCPPEQRRDELLKSYRFSCKCEACRRNYELLEDLPRYDDDFQKPPALNIKYSLKSLVDEYYKNCSYINENFNKFPSYELCSLIDCNQQLLNSIVCLTSSSSSSSSLLIPSCNNLKRN